MSEACLVGSVVAGALEAGAIGANAVMLGFFMANWGDCCDLI